MFLYNLKKGHSRLIWARINGGNGGNGRKMVETAEMAEITCKYCNNV